MVAVLDSKDVRCVDKCCDGGGEYLHPSFS
jgi:hypothetical protein